MSIVGADDEEALTAARAAGALLESHHIGRNVDDAVRGDDRPGLEREMDSAVELPIGDVHRRQIQIGDANVFLGLVARGRIGFDAGDGDGSQRGLRERDARVLGGIGAQGPAGVRDAVGDVPVRAARADKIDEDVGARRDDGLIRRPRAVAPLEVVEHGVRCDEVGHRLDVIFDDELVGRRAGRQNPLVHDRSHPAQEHLAGLRRADDDVVDPVPVRTAGGRKAARAPIERMALVVVIRADDGEDKGIVGSGRAVAHRHGHRTGAKLIGRRNQGERAERTTAVEKDVGVGEQGGI